MRRDPEDDLCPVCRASFALEGVLPTHEDRITCGETGHDHPGPGERYFRVVCQRCSEAAAAGAFPCGATFAEARGIVNAGDAARLALDAGDA